MNDTKRIQAREVMEQDFVMVDGMTTVTEAVELMRQNSAHHLIINRRTKHDEYGIVVPSDIATRVLAQNRSADRVNVYEIMSKPVLFIRPEMDIRYCARFFGRFGISAAPVISRGEIQGLVSYQHLVLKGICP
ncbi:MAG: CBS domain-containing protein [Chromatiales bacterium]|jgi:predicted transcriptional regulator